MNTNAHELIKGGSLFVLIRVNSWLESGGTI
jgi:hypothetical protein